MSTAYSRRSFVQSCAVVSGGAYLGMPWLAPVHRGAEGEGKIMTVSGPIDPSKLGVCLPHEHVLSRFGTEPAEPAVYDEKVVSDEVVPYLRYLRELGIGAVADCTAYSFGRAPELLYKLAEKSGLHLLTNTGWYGAADDRYVPEIAYRLSAEAIADRWIAEYNDGIGDSGIRPGFVKTAVDSGPLSPIDAKLVRAAALTHQATGLTLAIHTGDNEVAALQQLEILAEVGVSPSAWTWTHAQNCTTTTPLIEAARRGAWISLDGLQTPYFANGTRQGTDNLDVHLNHLLELRGAGLLDRVIISHDGSTFPPAGTVRRPMDIISNTFSRLLRAHGFSPSEVTALTVGNPARYLTISKRLLE